MSARTPPYTLRQSLESLSETERFKCAEKFQTGPLDATAANVDNLLQALTRPESIESRLVKMPDDAIRGAIRQAMEEFGGYLPRNEDPKISQRWQVADDLLRSYGFGFAREVNWRPLGIGGTQDCLAVFPEITCSYLRSTSPKFRTFMQINTIGDAVLKKVGLVLRILQSPAHRQLGWETPEVRELAARIRANKPVVDTKDALFLLHRLCVGCLKRFGPFRANQAWGRMSEPEQIHTAFELLLTIPDHSALARRFGGKFLQVCQSLEPMKWYFNGITVKLTLLEFLADAAAAQTDWPLLDSPSASSMRFSDLAASVLSWLSPVFHPLGLLDIAQERSAVCGVRLREKAWEVFGRGVAWDALGVPPGPAKASASGVAASPGAPLDEIRAAVSALKAVPSHAKHRIQVTGDLRSPTFLKLLQESDDAAIEKLSVQYGSSRNLNRKRLLLFMAHELSRPQRFFNRIAAMDEPSSLLLFKVLQSGGVMPLEKGIESGGIDAVTAQKLQDEAILFFRPSLVQPEKAVAPLETFFLGELNWEEQPTLFSMLRKLNGKSLQQMLSYHDLLLSGPLIYRAASIYEKLRSEMDARSAPSDSFTRTWIDYLASRDGKVTARTFMEACESPQYDYYYSQKLDRMVEHVFSRGHGESGRKDIEDLFFRGILALAPGENGEALVCFPEEFQEKIAGQRLKELAQEKEAALQDLYASETAPGNHLPWGLLEDLRRLFVAVAACPVKVTLKGLAARPNLKRLNKLLNWDPDYLFYLTEVARRMALLSPTKRGYDKYLTPSSIAVELLEGSRTDQARFFTGVFIEMPNPIELALADRLHRRQRAGLKHLRRQILFGALIEAGEKYLNLKPWLSLLLRDATWADLANSVSRPLEDSKLSFSKLVDLYFHGLHRMGFVEVSPGLESLQRARLSQIGRLHFLEKNSEKLNAMKAPEDRSFVVQPNGDILVSIYHPLSMLIEMTRFAELVKLDRVVTFHLNDQALKTAVRLGAEPARILDFLKRHSARELPQPIVFQIQDLERRLGEARMARLGGCIRFANPEALEAIAEHEQVKPFVHARVGNYLLLKPGARMETIAQILEKQGFFVPDILGNQEPRPEVVKLSTGLQGLLGEIEEHTGTVEHDFARAGETDENLDEGEDYDGEGDYEEEDHEEEGDYEEEDSFEGFDELMTALAEINRLRIPLTVVTTGPNGSRVVHRLRDIKLEGSGISGTRVGSDEEVFVGFEEIENIIPGNVNFDE